MGTKLCLSGIVYRYLVFTLTRGMAILSATDIHKKYGSVEVLKGVDVAIERGEIVSIVGSSGAGKSTLLHILGTLDKADGGTVHMNGDNITGLQGKKLAAFRNKHIGFVFQFHHLLPEFTAIENVCIPGWIAGGRRSDVKSRAEELLTMLGLQHRLQNKPSALSGGEQQRVAVARALINNPSVVFADEPTGNLDSANARDLHHLFFDLRKNFEQTFLIVTHNEELAELSDRILHMKDGKIV
jgi:lipoprotein-releasing system ATP-binding protein